MPEEHLRQNESLEEYEKEIKKLNVFSIRDLINLLSRALMEDGANKAF